MDRIMAEVDIKSKVKAGDTVVLLGGERGVKFDAWDWSKVIKTIPYEVTCSISKRVPRVYKK